MWGDPYAVKLINTVLESSGLNPIMFGPQSAPQQMQGSNSTQSIKEFSEKQIKQ
jgi:hypothetical protein